MCANMLMNMRALSCRLLAIDSIIDVYSSLTCPSVRPFLRLSVYLSVCLSQSIFILVSAFAPPPPPSSPHPHPPPHPTPLSLSLSLAS